ncbi:MAG: hypothetical protein RDV48_02045 [Candidatus Eremiobacteraeota bacterium]|nr:hypothetical protein [Candidatus Eremiobacteraeota bacterium]
MVRYVQTVFESFIKFLGKWTFPLLIVTLVTCAVGAVLALMLYKTNREAYMAAMAQVRRVLLKSAMWAVLITVLLLEISFLKAICQGVVRRIDQASAARYTSESDAGSGSEAVQYVPSITYNDRTERTQRLIIPKYTLNYINAQGLNFVPGWSPEELRYDTRPIMNIDDQLEKDENAIVINRKITVDRFLPLKLKESDINVKFTFLAQGNRAKRQFYKADFSGRYGFSNPFQEKRIVHFSFPLPYSSGTLSDFKFRVDGKDVSVEDVTNGYEWVGEVEPQKAVSVEVAYSHNGSRSWTYNLSARREAISSFKMNVDSNNARIKFLRGSLPPTKKSLTGTTLTWDLSGLITSQDISLYFPGISISELITRLYLFAPIALAGFVVLILLWAHKMRIEITPLMLVLATLAYSAGFALTAYLLTSLPLAAAILLSFAAGLVINLRLLGMAMMPPLCLLALIPLTFVSVGNTGLLLCILGLAALGALAWYMPMKAPATSPMPAGTAPMEQ